MTSLRKFSIVLLVVAALAGLMAAPAQAQLTLSCNAASFPTSMNVGTYYTLNCTTSGGTSPYTYSLSGSVPSGMSFGQVGGEYLVEGNATAAGTFSFTVSVSDIAGHTGTPASYTVTVGGSGTGTGGTSVTISSFSPTTLTPGVAQYLTIYGSGFTSNTTVYFNGNAIAATYQSSGQVYVFIPANYLFTGTSSIYVNSGGVNSNTQTIVVGTGSTGGALSLSSISPTSTPVGVGFTLYLFGSGFSQGQLVTFGSYTLSSTFLSSGEISVVIPSNYVATAQTINVSVAGSNTQSFSIGAGGSSGSLTISCNPNYGPTTSNIYYSQFCTVGNGNGSYLWSFGNLPTGMAPTSTQGSTIGISGTPTSLPPYTYTITVNDTAGHTGTLTISSTGSTGAGGYTISSLSPSTVGIGSGTITMIVYGSGFTTASQVLFNGIALPTTYVSASQLNAVVYSTYLTTAETVSVYVSSSGVTSNSLSFIVGSGGSTSGVSLSSMSPTAASLNSQAVTLYLYGSGFSQGQLVTFGTNSFGTQFVSSNELIATIPSQFFTTAGVVNVSVAGSNSLQFTIGAGGSTGALSVSCSPTTGPTLLSTSFTQTCQVLSGTAPFTWSAVGLPTGLVLNSTTGSVVSITGNPVVAGNYSYTITVTDSSASRLNGSQTISGSVGSSAYSITSLSPSTVSVGSGTINLTVLGTGFSTGSYVYFNGGQLATQYVSSSQLNATLPNSYLTISETASVNVNTSGVYTNTLPFTIGSGSGTTGGTLSVVCTPGVGPSTVGSAYSTTCTASGGTQPYNWPTPAGLPTYLTFSTTTGPSVTITGTPGAASPYNFTVKVTDSSSPQQSGSLQLAGETSSSNSGTGSLLLTSLSPTTAPVNSGSVTLTILGSGFTNTSQVVFNGFPIVTTFISANQLFATIPAGQLTFALSALVTVTTPGVGSSNSLTFVVGNGGTGVQVTITCTPGVGPVTPNAYYTTNCGVNGGTGPYTWSISSGSLPSGLSLSPNGPLATITGYETLNGIYNYTLQVADSSSPQNVGTLVFAGSTGAGSGGTTTGLSISSLSPSSIPIGSAQFTLSVIGSNFTTASVVYFNGSPLSTIYISTGQLNATVPSGLLTAQQNATITVNSSGVTSNALTFTVGTATSTAPITISCNPTTGPSSAGTIFTTYCTATGGKAPYTWTGVGLPFGLVLTNSQGAANVTLTGSVTGGGYNFSIQVTDSSTTPVSATYPFVGTFAATPASSITSMSPVSAPSGSGQVTLIITGTGFVNGVTTALFANNALLTTVNSANQLTALVPASLLLNTGSQIVQLSGTPSNSVDFFVTAGGSSGGVSPGTLSFTYGIGGTLPSAQTVNVTSLGGATGFSAVASGAADGITWLALAQGSSAIPGSISVIVNPQGLPVGTYSGTVTLTGFGVGTSVTVPVTLNVVGAPALTPSSTNLTLNASTGGSATQTIKVTSSDGVTVLPYSISVQSFNGGNWLSVSPTTGTTPGSFTVTATTTNLAPSTYSGIVTLSSTGTVGSQATIPVTLIVSTPGTISANPTSLTFNATPSANPAAQTISVTSGTNASVNYTVATAVSSGSGWLSATQSGTTPGSISVNVTSTSLAAGTYTGTVTITAPGATNSPLSVPVTVVVAAGPSLTGTPSTLSFSYQIGGTTPVAQSLSLSPPAGFGNLSYNLSAATSSGGNWLSVSPTAGFTPGSATVSVNPAGLSAGTYNGTITGTAAGVGNLSEAVTLTVTPAASTLSVTPTSLTFNAILNGSAPATQTVAVSTTSSVVANYTVSASSTGNWLSATQSGTTPGTVTVTVNQSGLALGAYTGTLTITAPGGTNSPLTVQVTLNVTATPMVVAVPGTLTFTVLPDGSTPAPQSITVISTGGNTAFTTSAVSQGGNWLTVTSGGTTPASVTASVNPAGLSAGTYNGAVSITAPASTPTNIQVPVTLVVSAQGPATLAAAPTAVYLTYTQGAGTDLQHIAILNNGSGTVNFTAQATTANCGNWITVLNPSGSATASTPAVLAFNVNPSGLQTQTCRATLALNDGNGNITNVPVYMAVSSSAQAILLSQTAMNFSVSAAGATPPAQTFQVLNPGSGSLQYNIATKVLSGGSWLSVSPTSGSSSGLGQTGSPISVTVNPSSLTGGVYYGSVVVSSTGASNSPQTITVAVQVGPPGTNPPEQVAPNGVVLTGSNSQTVTITNIGTSSVTYSSATITDDGQNWLSVTPATGTVAGGGNNSITLSGATSGLSGGLRHGTLRIVFSDGSVQTVDVKLAVPGSAGTGTPGVSACGASNLAMVMVTPSQNFAAAANVAMPLQVLVEDCNGDQLTSSSTGVDVLVGTSDIRLNYTGNGIWAGTWTPTTAATVATLTARAVEITGGTIASGSATASGNVGPVGANAPPAVAAVLNAASYLLPGLVAPGAMVSIFGSNLADGQSQVFSVPFPTTLQGAQFTLRGLPLPLFYASNGQVNAVIPTGLATDERDQLLVVRDTTQSAPVDLLVADVDPGAFATNQQGTGQGAILVGGTSQLAAPAGSVQGAAPAKAGQTVSIFLSGMGAVTNPPADGSPSVAGTPSTTTVTPTVTIGGISATVSYSGLAPGEVGLYQLNVVVPAGVPTGSAVPVVITQGNGVANTVTMAIM